MDENPDVEARSKRAGALEKKTGNGKKILITIERRKGSSDKQYARAVASEMRYLREKGYARATTGRLNGAVIISYDPRGGN